MSLSATQVANLYRKAKKGDLDEAEVDQLLNQIPEEQKQQTLANLLDVYVIPHLEGVKSRAETKRSAEQVRAVYAAQDAETQQALFEDAVAEIVTTLFEVREDPAAGLLNLKELLRNPHTIEALLLIFENEEYIDPEYSTAMKEYVSERVTEIGVAIAPEMYDADTIRDVYERFGLDPEHNPRE